MKPFQVLGKLYIPDVEGMSPTENPLYELLDIPFGDWAYRPPGYPGIINYFHQDGIRRGGIIFWASEYPTEVKLINDGTILAGRPYEVVLVDNAAVRHKTPDAHVEAVRHSRGNRHFIRCIMDRDPTDEEINTWMSRIKKANDETVSDSR